MADDAPQPMLTQRERRLAGSAGAVLLLAAVGLVLLSPDRTVVIEGCTPTDTVECTATVDGDFGTFAAVLVAAAAIAILVALLGLRFTRIKAGGIDLGFEQKAQGLAKAPAEDPAGADEVPEETPDKSLVDEQPTPMAAQSVDDLNAERSGIYRRQHGLFLSHVLGRPSAAGEQKRIALFVVGHGRTQVTRSTVTGATFFLGERFGSRPVAASWGKDGLGIVTEAYDSFLVLCEVTLSSGARIRIDHYVDLSHGTLLD